MERSESIVKLATALLSAQKKIEAAVKDSANPFFRSKYADINSVMEACKSHLNDAGIVVTQLVESFTDGDFLTTLFIHSESGEYLSSRMKLQGTADGMQAYGSAVTYARRYMLQSMAFVGAEDDDGNAATGKKEPTKVEKKSTRVEKPADNMGSGSYTVPTPGDAPKPETVPTFSKKAVAAQKQEEPKKSDSKWDD